MQLFIFVVGFFVTMLVIYGVFSQVPGAIRSTEEEFYKNPRVAEVYNIGGGRESNCSMLEAIEVAQRLSGKKLDYSYTENNRSGDHIWYISDLSKFKSHYPEWTLKYNINQILSEIYESGIERWNDK